MFAGVYYQSLLNVSEGRYSGMIPENPNRLVVARANGWSENALPILATGRIHGQEINGIYTTNLQGDPWDLVVRPASQPNQASWSPDGTKIIFSAELDETGNTDIYVMNSDGTNITCLTDSSYDDITAFWGVRIE